jgi:hypothetical protein
MISRPNQKHMKHIEFLKNMPKSLDPTGQDIYYLWENICGSRILTSPHFPYLHLSTPEDKKEVIRLLDMHRTLYAHCTCFSFKEIKSFKIFSALNKKFQSFLVCSFKSLKLTGYSIVKHSQRVT